MSRCDNVKCCCLPLLEDLQIRFVAVFPSINAVILASKLHHFLHTRILGSHSGLVSNRPLLWSLVPQRSWYILLRHRRVRMCFSARRLFDETPRSTCFAVIVLAEEFVFAATSSTATFATADFAIATFSSAAFSTTAFPATTCWAEALSATTFSDSVFSVATLSVGYALDVLLHVLSPAFGYALLFVFVSFHPQWVRSFLPAVGPLFSVIHHGVLDLRRRRLLVDSPLSSTELLASCLQHHPVWSYSLRPLTCAFKLY